MAIFIDSDYKCHVQNDGTMREIDAPFFEGKCPEFIEGHRYVPQGEVWHREDGKLFIGEMKTVWANYDRMVKAQLEYENAQYEAALTAIETALGVTS